MNDIQARLEALAYRLTTPFCYGCYVDAPSGRCPNCDSDDLMRHRPGDGVEWGVDWVIPRLVSENVTPIDVDQLFEESLQGSYPERVRVGWLEVDVAEAIKALDRVFWEMAKNEYVDGEVTEGNLVTTDGGEPYYLAADVLAYVEATEEAFDEGGALAEMARDKLHYPGGASCPI